MTRAFDGARSISISVSLSALLALAAVGCGSSSSGTPGGSGGSGGGGNGGGLLYNACPAAMRAGGFVFTMKPASAGMAGFGQLNGAVRDKALPKDVWKSEMDQGPCRLMVPPACTACTLPMVCDGMSCVPGPTPKSVGNVTITGLATALTAMPIGDNKTYYTSISADPPFTTGADISLQTGGGDYPSFTLRGRGVPAVEASATPVQVRSGQPLTLTWTAPPAPVVTKMDIEVDIAHHGGVAAIIECEAPDTGSLTISAAMVDALIAKGTAGFPIAHLHRQTVDSTTVGGGCVDFAVLTKFNGEEGVPLVVNGQQSCTMDSECPTGKTCAPAGTPNGLSCV